MSPRLPPAPRLHLGRGSAPPRPRLGDRAQDAKASLEAELKGACEGLIGHVSAQLTQPLLPFLASYGAAAASDAPEPAADGRASGGELQSAALPSAEACAAVLTQAVRYAAATRLAPRVHSRAASRSALNARPSTSPCPCPNRARVLAPRAPQLRRDPSARAARLAIALPE